jgi:hypothetical protein
MDERNHGDASGRRQQFAVANPRERLGHGPVNHNEPHRNRPTESTSPDLVNTGNRNSALGKQLQFR